MSLFTLVIDQNKGRASLCIQCAIQPIGVFNISHTLLVPHKMRFSSFFSLLYSISQTENLSFLLV